MEIQKRGQKQRSNRGGHWYGYTKGRGRGISDKEMQREGVRKSSPAEGVIGMEI